MLSERELGQIYSLAPTFIPTPEQWSTHILWIGPPYVPEATAELTPKQYRMASAYCARGAISRALLELGFKDWKPGGSNEKYASSYMAGQLGLRNQDNLGVWNRETGHTGVIAGFNGVAATIS